MRSILIALLLAMVTLAGCSSDEPTRPAEVDDTPIEDDDSHVDDSNDAPVDDDEEPVATTPEANETEEANIAPKILQFVPDATSGQIPFDVTFAINATDANNDTLSWIVQLGEDDIDGGEQVPASSGPHTIDTAGNHTFILFVFDGQEASNVTVTIVATEEVVEAPAEFEPWTFSGTAMLSCIHCVFDYNMCVSLNAGTGGADCVFSELPAGAPGRLATFDSDTGFVSFDFMTDCSGSGAGLQGASDEAPGYQTVVPDGAGCVVLYETLIPVGTFQIDIA